VFDGQNGVSVASQNQAGKNQISQPGPRQMAKGGGGKILPEEGPEAVGDQKNAAGPGRGKKNKRKGAEPANAYPNKVLRKFPGKGGAMGKINPREKREKRKFGKTKKVRTHNPAKKRMWA